MWIGEQIDNLIELLGANKYSKMEIEKNGDVTINITIQKPKFRYIKNKRQIKFYNSKETVIINVWASTNITIDEKNLIYKIVLDWEELVILKMYL